MIKVNELVLTLRVMQDMDYDKTQDSTIELIDSVLCKKTNNVHYSNRFKHYVVNKVVPYKEVYKTGDRVTFRIRTVDNELLYLLQEQLMNRETSKLLVLNIKSRYIQRKAIAKMKTITACVITSHDVKGYWRASGDDEIFERNIIGNLVDKYYAFTGKEKVSKIDFDDIFTGYYENNTFYPTKYKNITLLGDKVTFEVNNTEFANELAYFALGVGLGTKNTRGFGFLDAFYR